MLLQNDRIKLRAVEPEDIEFLYQWENNSDYWNADELRTPYSHFVIKQFVLSSGKDIYENKQIRFIIEEKKTGKAAGAVDLFDFDLFNSRAGVGILIEKTYQGLGLASSALQLIKEYGQSYLQLHQLYAHIAVTNTASCKAFEKAGFERTAILKEWIKKGERFTDITLYQAIKS